MTTDAGRTAPQFTFAPARAIVAGWAGRNDDAIRHHIEELEALGVPAPSAVPLFYRVSAALFTTAGRLEAVGPDSSGEVEPLLVHGEDGRIRLGLGSDHTDRALETHSVALSKQVCGKPVAPEFWDFAEVEPHADSVELRAWIRDGEDEDWTLYQQGTLADLRPLRDLIAGARAAHGDDAFSPGSAMLCGTFPVVAGGIRPARHFSMAMHDPVLGRTIRHCYETVTLPAVS